MTRMPASRRIITFASLLCLLWANSGWADNGKFDCARRIAPPERQAYEICRTYEVFSTIAGDPVAREAREKCLSFFTRAAEARQLICDYQEAAESRAQQSGASAPMPEQAKLLTEKGREFVRERDSYYLAVNKLGSLAGRTFLDEARGERKSGMSSQAPSFLLAGLAARSLDDLQYSSRLMTLALRWSVNDARGRTPDTAAMKKQLDELGRKDPQVLRESEPSKKTPRHSEESKNLLTNAARVHTIDRIAILTAEAPAEKFLEHVAESQFAWALPASVSHYAGMLLPKAAGAAVVLAFEAMENNGHLEPLTIAAIGAGAVGGFAVSVAASSAEAAYRNYQNQQAYLEEYREFASDYVRKHDSATSYEVSRAFFAHREKESEQVKHSTEKNRE